MTSMPTETRPEVAAFVVAVKARLTDLSEEEREELVGGLEADLAELVGEKGAESLGDPVAYAAELRSAAGLEPRRRASRGSARVLVRGWAGEARAWLQELVRRPRVAPVWEVLVALRPAWWVLRGWAVAQVLVAWSGGGNDWAIVPEPQRSVALGLVVLAGCVALSVLVGLRRLWPGTSRGWIPRTALLALDVVAVLAVLIAPGMQETRRDLYDAWDESAYASGPIQGIFTKGGNEVVNVFAYDAAGKPLIGVQLFDQDGTPIVLRSAEEGSVFYDAQGRRHATYPWFNGNAKLFNVFPLPVGPDYVENGEWTLTTPDNGIPNIATLPTPPMSAVPPVTLPTPAPSAEAQPAS